MIKIHNLMVYIFTQSFLKVETTIFIKLITSFQRKDPCNYYCFHFSLCIFNGVYESTIKRLVLCRRNFLCYSMVASFSTISSLSYKSSLNSTLNVCCCCVIPLVPVYWFVFVIRLTRLGRSESVNTFVQFS